MQSFSLAKPADCHFATLAHLCHPLTQRADRYFTANDDNGWNSEPRTLVKFHDKYEHGRHHEFVCHGVQKCAKSAFYLPQACKVAVQPVGDTGNAEYKTAQRPGPRIIEIEHHHDNW